MGIPVLTQKVDAANARIEFANGTVANVTASRIGMEKIRKMRFFQPYDFVAVDYATGFASLSGLGPPAGGSLWPTVRINRLETEDVEPLRAEVEAFVRSCQEGNRGAHLRFRWPAGISASAEGAGTDRRTR